MDSSVHTWRKTARGVRARGAAAVIAGLLTVAACSSRGSGPAAPGPPPGTSAGAGSPRITVQRTGGLAGVQETVVVAPDGAWTASGGAGAGRGGRLTAAQLAGIRTLAADPRLAGEAARTPERTRCSDAFEYVLTVGSERVGYADCPADADRPAASMALVGRVLAVTAATAVTAAG